MYARNTKQRGKFFFPVATCCHLTFSAFPSPYRDPIERGHARVRLEHSLGETPCERAVLSFALGHKRFYLAIPREDFFFLS